MKQHTRAFLAGLLGSREHVAEHEAAARYASMKRWQTIMLLVGIIGLIVCIIGAILNWPRFLHAWLLATLIWVALPFGAWPALMTHNLTGGGWGEIARPALKSMLATMPLFAIAFIPLLIGVADIFSWSAPKDVLPEIVRHKSYWLNEPALIGRTIFYLFLWLFFAWRLDAFAATDRRSGALSAGGLIVWGYSLTFFSFDWILSLEPRFYSDIYGLIYLTSVLVPAIAILFFSLGLERRHPDSLRTGRVQDLANIWMSTIISWVIMLYSQYLLIWNGDIPDEIRWYIHRSQGGWSILSWIVGALIGIVFLGLILRRIKRSRDWMMVLGAMMLTGYVVFMYWFVMPAFAPQQITIHWYEPVAFLTIGGFWLAMFLANLARDWAAEALPETRREEVEMTADGNITLKEH